MLVGKHSYFASEPTLMWADNGSQLIVGNFCSIAPGLVVYLGGNHYMNRISAYPFEHHLQCGNTVGLTSESKGDVVIGNDVWIGDYVVLMSGITIGDGCIIGAHSVVRGEVPPYTIAYGNPCQRHRDRFSQVHTEMLLEIKWWDWEDHLIQKAYPLLRDKDFIGLYDFYLKEVIH